MESTSFCSARASTAPGVTTHPSAGQAPSRMNGSTPATGQRDGSAQFGNGVEMHRRRGGNERLRYVCVSSTPGSQIRARASSARTSRTCAPSRPATARTRKLPLHLRKKLLCGRRQRRFVEPAAVQPALHTALASQPLATEYLEQAGHDIPHAETALPDIQIIVVDECNHVAFRSESRHAKSMPRDETPRQAGVSMPVIVPRVARHAGGSRSRRRYDF